MSRPALEVADIVRAAGDSFWDKHKSHFAWVHRKVLDAILRCRTAALGGHLDKCVRCGHQAISYNSCRDRNCPKCQGNARCPSGWLRVRLSCCPCLTSTSSSPCHTNSPHWSSRTSGCSTICSSAPAQLRCSNLLAIPSTWERISGSSAFSIRGDRTSKFIPTYTTSFPPAALHSMVPDGLTRRVDSSCPSKHSARSSAASSARNYGNCSYKTDCSSTMHSSSLPHLAHSAASSGNSARRTGPHPTLRLLRQPKKANRPRTLPPVARRCYVPRSPRNNQPAALSRMLRRHAGHRTDRECSTLLPARHELRHSTEVQQ